MLSFQRQGGGEPLLLIHGLGGSHVVWEPVVPRLAAERDVIAIDLPGFGESPLLPAGREPTARALAVAVADCLDELGVESPHVAGNSLGGWVALELERLGHARSVTAIAPAGLWTRPLGPRRGPDTRALGRSLRPLLRLAMKSARARSAILAGSFAHPDRVSAEAARRIIESYLDAPSFDAANHAMRSDVLQLHPTDRPVTLAWPDRDRLVRRPETLPAWVRTITLHGCGHIPMWDDPEQVADVLLAGSSRTPAKVEAWT